MKVTLLQHTGDPEKIVAAAAKLCYSESGVENILEGLTEEKSAKFLNMLMDLGHESPIEHVSFTFGIEGVSRSLLAQITRHRIASYSVKSQRYVKEGMFAYILPPEIEAVPEAKEIFLNSMEKAHQDYLRISEILSEKYEKEFLETSKDEIDAIR